MSFYTRHLIAAIVVPICTLALSFLPAKVSGQLPGRTEEAKLSEQSSAIVRHQPVLKENNRVANLVALDFTASIGSKWCTHVEISSIEKMYPTGAPFVLRNEHILSSQSLTRKIRFANHLLSLGKFHLSNTVMWDNHTGAIVTRVQSLATSFEFKKKSSLNILIENRWDIVKESFNIKDIAISDGNYSFKTVSVHYKQSEYLKAGWFAESTAGLHYDLSRYSLRCGERIKVTSKLEMQADVEFTRIFSEESASGLLSRVKMDWQPHKNIEINVVALSNSLIELSAMIICATWSRAHHQYRLEYREIRNDSFRYIETSHPLFSSRILFQYRYFIRNEK